MIWLLLLLTLGLLVWCVVLWLEIAEVRESVSEAERKAHTEHLNLAERFARLVAENRAQPTTVSGILTIPTGRRRKAR